MLLAQGFSGCGGHGACAMVLGVLAAEHRTSSADVCTQMPGLTQPPRTPASSTRPPRAETCTLQSRKAHCLPLSNSFIPSSTGLIRECSISAGVSLRTGPAVWRRHPRSLGLPVLGTASRHPLGTWTWMWRGHVSLLIHLLLLGLGPESYCQVPQALGFGYRSTWRMGSSEGLGVRAK